MMVLRLPRCVRYNLRSHSNGHALHNALGQPVPKTTTTGRQAGQPQRSFAPTARRGATRVPFNVDFLFAMRR